VWGWRIPFLLSAVLVAVGLWIRLGILETPVFARLLREKKVERAPITQALRRHPKEIALSALARLAEQTPFYIFTAFVFSYARLGGVAVSRDLLLVAVLAASVVELVTIPLSGHISDRIGRKRTYMLGAALIGAFSFVYFWMLGTGSPALVVIAVVASLVPHALMYGPQAALIAESFTGGLRYSGASLGYQLASVIAGGPAPLVATWLLARYRSPYAIAGYILACSVATLVATASMKDHTGGEIDEP
jgi:MFS family permease